jgi:hypothetical protein
VLTSYVELMDFLILLCFLLEKIAAKIFHVEFPALNCTCGLKCTVMIYMAGIVWEHLKKIIKLILTRSIYKGATAIFLGLGFLHISLS